MGYDYYTVCYLNINLNDQTNKMITFDRRGMYADYSWDSDSEDDQERQCKLYEEKLQKREQKNDKQLYENGKWLITAKNKISGYTDLINKANITFGQIASIEKCNYIERRY